MKSRHDKAEDDFIGELMELKKLRYDALAEYPGSTDDIKGIVDIFRVADELTALAIGAIKIDHELTNQVVAVIASVIYGITRGSVESEIIDLITMVLRRRAILQEKENKTKH